MPRTPSKPLKIPPVPRRAPSVHRPQELSRLLPTEDVINHDNRPAAEMSEFERRQEINRLSRDSSLTVEWVASRYAELADLPPLYAFREKLGPPVPDTEGWEEILSALPTQRQRYGRHVGRLDPGIMTKVREMRRGIDRLEGVRKVRERAELLVEAVENATALFVDEKRPVLPPEPQAPEAEEAAPVQGGDLFELTGDDDLFG